MATFVFIVSWMFLCLDSPVEQSEPETIYRTLLSHLDSQYPGRGSDLLHKEPLDYPMGYAMVLLAEANRYRATADPSARARISRCGSWLLANPDRDDDGTWGYGLPVSWDAFSDGSTNAAHHEYTITVSMVIEALLTWMEMEPEIEPAVLDVVQRCLEPYLSGMHDSPSGLYAYSLAECDQRYDVFNPAVYLAGQMQRLASRLTGRDADELRVAAEEQVRIAMDHQFVWQPSGNFYWNYGIQRAQPNDLTHALYMVESLRTFVRYGGMLPTQERWVKTREHYKDFLQGSRYFEHITARHQTPQRNVRSWALGMLLCTLSRERQKGELDRFIPGQLSRYVDASGRIKYKKNDPSIYVRHETHVLYGLSCYLFENADFYGSQQ